MSESGSYEWDGTYDTDLTIGYWITEAKTYGIPLVSEDFTYTEDDGYSLDGMYPGEWLESMTSE